MTTPQKTALSVNLNKVALLRNSRTLGIPSIIRAATLCLEAGANGITVHPRPDARHIREQDVQVLHSLVKKHPEAEFNIEGNPFHNLIDFVRAIRPTQATFVPDAVSQFTSNCGWSLPQDSQRLKPLIAEVKAMGVRVSLFMDPIPQKMAEVKALGADRVELYTESYARAYGTAEQEQVLHQFVETARAARRVGLEVNAGHDLNFDNLGTLIKRVPEIREVSIGHALIADSLEFGYSETVKRYVRCIEEAQKECAATATATAA